ncbi:ATP-dependent DNA helicase RecG [Candidatus Falkowbacteria bacterium]|nr:ATP-dependent DNA helicase RecG [Candidatus Falkowbacteria bacterium]
MDLHTPVLALHPIAKKIGSALKRIGIETVADLIFYYPARYDDFSTFVPIAALRPGVVATVRGTIQLMRNQRAWKKRLLVTEAIIQDSSGSVKAVWFGQYYVSKILKPGDEVYLAGRVDADRGVVFYSPSFEKVTKAKEGGGTHTGRLVPVYSLTKGISSKQLRYLVSLAWKALPALADYLPAALVRQLHFPALSAAVRQIHFPDSQVSLERARQRLQFEEIFLLQLKNQLVRRRLRQLPASPVSFHEAEIKRFVSSLPFVLTPAQRRSAWEIVKDLGRPYPMNRLLEGDVGSGKTVVASLALLNTALGGAQAALMAPTEILARQHYTTIRQLLQGQKFLIGLLTRTESRVNDTLVDKRELIAGLKDGRVKVVVGTHALIQGKIQFHHLALAVVDEQHRFGVAQRQALQDKSGETSRVPHFLSMTATPIPRSLALTLYGDLDLSILDTLPAGRKKIITKIVSPADRAKAYDFIRQQVAAGPNGAPLGQAFVICPLIDPSDKLGVRSVTEEHKKLDTEVFPDLVIGCLHGRLKSAERERVMADFVAGKVKILVATSVVEVGVDVPNASVMMIEGAERFGLAQLHQFRGRVGRSSHQSYCFLFTDTESENSRARLQTLVDSNDGFALAEADLRFRGAGEMFGTSQSGESDLKLANLFDVQRIKQAQQWVGRVMAEDPDLANHPLLRAKIGELGRAHLE